MMKGIPSWLYVASLITLVVAIAVLLIFFLPRTEEIIKLRQQIRDLRAMLERTSKCACAEHDEHVADVGELSDLLLQAWQQTKKQEEEHADQIAGEQARRRQQKRITKQIARAASNMEKWNGRRKQYEREQNRV